MHLYLHNVSSRRQHIPKRQCPLQQLLPTSHLWNGVVALPTENHGSHFCTRPLPDGNDWWQMTLTKDVPTFRKQKVLDRPCCRAGHPLLSTLFIKLSFLESTRMTAVFWTLVLRLPQAVALERTHGREFWNTNAKRKHNHKWMHRAEGLVWSSPSCLFFGGKKS